ncbi:unnamed protein product [Orchesella dallaii]|uniref:Uncharacterized protein n=1 Tax=Orchesella dallaii TaxID=48710 RepID=A0ABP1QP98_9HEXA
MAAVPVPSGALPGPSGALPGPSSALPGPSNALPGPSRAALVDLVPFSSNRPNLDNVLKNAQFKLKNVAAPKLNSIIKIWTGQGGGILNMNAVEFSKNDISMEFSTNEDVARNRGKDHADKLEEHEGLFDPLFPGNDLELVSGHTLDKKSAQKEKITVILFRLCECHNVCDMGKRLPTMVFGPANFTVSFKYENKTKNKALKFLPGYSDDVDFWVSCRRNVLYYSILNGEDEKDIFPEGLAFEALKPEAIVLSFVGEAEPEAVVSGPQSVIMGLLQNPNCYMMSSENNLFPWRSELMENIQNTKLKRKFQDEVEGPAPKAKKLLNFNKDTDATRTIWNWFTYKILDQRLSTKSFLQVLDVALEYKVLELLDRLFNLAQRRYSTSEMSGNDLWNIFTIMIKHKRTDNIQAVCCFRTFIANELSMLICAVQKETKNKQLDTSKAASIAFNNSENVDPGIFHELYGDICKNHFPDN